MSFADNKISRRAALTGAAAAVATTILPAHAEDLLLPFAVAVQNPGKPGARLSGTSSWESFAELGKNSVHDLKIIMSKINDGVTLDGVSRETLTRATDEVRQYTLEHNFGEAYGEAQHVLVVDRAAFLVINPEKGTIAAFHNLEHNTRLPQKVALKNRALKENAVIFHEKCKAGVFDIHYPAKSSEHEIYADAMVAVRQYEQPLGVSAAVPART